MKFTIEYDTSQKTIQVPIYVTPPPPADEEPRVWTPPVAIPFGSWTVTWKVDPASPERVTFKDPYVSKKDNSDLPVLALISPSVDFDQCTVTVTAANSAHGSNACDFLLHLRPTDPNAKCICHDPTIAVTKDPLDPPT